MKNTLLLVLLPTLLGVLISTSASCISRPTRHYYQLNLEPPAETASDSSGKSLAISRIEMDDFYDGYRIAYRDSKYEVNRYQYHLWYKKPSAMIRDVLFSHFQSRRLFRKTFRNLTEGDPDYTISCRIEQLEEIFEGKTVWARLGMRLQLMEHKKGTVLHTHQFDRREAVSGSRVVDTVKTLCTILEDELTAFSRQIVLPPDPANH